MYSISKLQAYIRVLDMNEHRPVFLKPLYKVRLEEYPVDFLFYTEYGVIKLTAELSKRIFFTDNLGYVRDANRYIQQNYLSQLTINKDYTSISQTFFLLCPPLEAEKN